MKYMRNPISGHIQPSSPLQAKRLARYGWTYATKDEYIHWMRSSLQASMIKHMPAAAKKLGRMQ